MLEEMSMILSKLTSNIKTKFLKSLKKKMNLNLAIIEVRRLKKKKNISMKN